MSKMIRTVLSNHNYSQIALLVAGVAVLIVISAVLNIATNELNQERCEGKGGEYARAIDASKSLCLIPRKDSK